MTSHIDDIIEFWIGDAHDSAAAVARQNRMWFEGGPELDREIETRFGARLAAAAAGALDRWRATPRGELALVILLDQFSRNVYRGTARAFAQDRQALAICEAGIERGSDRALRTLERAFFYFPLHHSEVLAHQEECVRRLGRLLEGCEPHLRDNVQNNHDYAVEHCAVVRRFGRFPHRNALLGRSSTAEEREYLGAGAKRYGQSSPEPAGDSTRATRE